MRLSKKSEELFYYLGLFFVTVSSTMVGRTYLFLIPHLNPILKCGAILFFFLSFLSKGWNRRTILVSVLAIFIVLQVAVITDSNILFIYILALVVSKTDTFDKICKFLFWLNLSLLIAVFFLYGIGILHDEITVNDGVNAHSLGFAYYSSPAYTVLFLTILGYYLYSGRIHTFKRITFYILSAIANYGIYKLTTVKLTLFIYLILLVLIVFAEYLNLIQKVKLNKAIGTIMYPLMFGLSIVLPFIYNRSQLFVKLDAALNGRLYFSFLGFTRYKIRLFGNMIVTDGGGFDEYWHNTYFYIDSGYVRLFLGYGIILCTAILFVYIMVSRYAAIHKNTKLFIWCILVCIFGFINNPFVDIILNPLLFVTVPVFHEIRAERKNSGGVTRQRN